MDPSWWVLQQSCDFLDTFFFFQITKFSFQVKQNTLKEEISCIFRCHTYKKNFKFIYVLKHTQLIKIRDSVHSNRPKQFLFSITSLVIFHKFFPQHLHTQRPDCKFSL